MHWSGRGWDLAPIITCIVFLVTTTIPNSRSKKDHILRGGHEFNFGPSLLFAGLRLCDPIACFYMLSNGRQSDLGTKDVIVLSMILVASLRQMYWIFKLNLNTWSWDLGFSVAFVNNWMSWTYVQCLRVRGPHQSVDFLTYISIGLFALGSLLETISEAQRKSFKSDPANKGKLFTGGLFGYARHINYLGYILWRIGLGLISGPPYTLCYGLHFGIDFYVRAIPLLNGHMQQKYGKVWDQYKLKTKSVLIPGIL